LGMLGMGRHGEQSGECESMRCGVSQLAKPIVRNRQRRQIAGAWQLLLRVNASDDP
jgi:hypothetical protein